MKMIKHFRRLLKGALPNFIYQKFKERRAPIRYKYGFSSWMEAKAASTGYSENSILEKVSSQTALIVARNSGWVRDGYYFPEAKLDFEILSVLSLHTAKTSKLRVLDFGGALGTTYFQNRRILEKFGIAFCWNIIEQPNFVREGKQILGSFNNLHFFESFKDATPSASDLVIFSSVLEYLEDPYRVLQEIMDWEVKPLGIVIDRSPIDAVSSDKYVVQSVDESIHRAKLPLRILGQDRITEILSNGYSLISDWVSSTQPDSKSVAKGLYFLRKD